MAHKTVFFLLNEEFIENDMKDDDRYHSEA